MIFHFLWKNPKKIQVIDPYTSMIEESVFHSNSDWGGFYGGVEEDDLPRMIEPLGEPVSTSTSVDSDHASNVVTRKSNTGILLFLLNGLIKDFSKKQNTVESSTFGSELVALCISRDLIVELRIKMNSVGVSLKGPTDVYCDN